MANDVVNIKKKIVLKFKIKDLNKICILLNLL